MRNFKLTLEYDGTGFCGWQEQSQGERTLQGELKKVLSGIFKTPVSPIASGRTDAGVHALGQVVSFKVQTRMTPAQIQKALNALLPSDMAVIEVKEVSDRFHAILSVKSKTYRYTILNRPYPSAIHRNHCHFHPAPLNVGLMGKESKHLIGTKDFKSFEASDPVRGDHSTVRTVKSIVIKKKGDWITIDITADGFLYKMVRNMVGSLLDVGRGKTGQGSLQKILSQKDRTKAGETAVAHGLCLLKVRY